MPEVVIIAAFYRFAPLPDYALRRGPLADLCARQGVVGSILLAAEGVNGTIAGARAGVDTVLAALREFPGMADLEAKESGAAELPFARCKVRLKQEIVTLGAPEVSPLGGVGVYVEPRDWNGLVADPDVALIDTRNDYEVAIGRFEGAIDPGTKSFREFPGWFRDFHRTRPAKRYALYCTGGIRCEKATAFLRAEGIDEVYHLKGGILNYLKETPPAASRWRGECFVFDERVTVDHRLQPGGYEICRACGQPVSSVERAAPAFVPGVACPTCADSQTPERRRRFEERRRQRARTSAASARLRER